MGLLKEVLGEVIGVGINQIEGYIDRKITDKRQRKMLRSLENVAGAEEEQSTKQDIFLHNNPWFFKLSREQQNEIVKAKFGLDRIPLTEENISGLTGGQGWREGLKRIWGRPSPLVKGRAEQKRKQEWISQRRIDQEEWEKRQNFIKANTPPPTQRGITEANLAMLVKTFTPDQREMVGEIDKDYRDASGRIHFKSKPGEVAKFWLIRVDQLYLLGWNKFDASDQAFIEIEQAKEMARGKELPKPENEAVQKQKEAAQKQNEAVQKQKEAVLKRFFETVLEDQTSKKREIPSLRAVNEEDRPLTGEEGYNLWLQQQQEQEGTGQSKFVKKLLKGVRGRKEEFPPPIGIPAPPSVLAVTGKRRDKARAWILEKLGENPTPARKKEVLRLLEDLGISNTVARGLVPELR
jgi:hypothetical protein